MNSFVDSFARSFIMFVTVKGEVFWVVWVALVVRNFWGSQGYVI
jgi:hypothetical protein